MIRLRHILHPFGSAILLYERARSDIRRYIAQRRFHNIRRGHRDRCWCGGELLPFKWHPSYGVCADCDSYVNRHPPLREELERLYTFDLYWHTRMLAKGHPTIECRSSNDRSDGRVVYWLSLVERYGPPSGQVLEVGCAHGVLLTELKARGYTCIGVEPDEGTANWARQNIGLDVRSGFFPDIALPKCNLFMAFDVIEHSPDPEAFLRGAALLLNPEGVAIIQTPIDRYEYEPPFGERFTAAFDDIEHLFLFTDKAMRELGRRTGLLVVSASERLWLHHEICLFRKT